MLTVEEYCSKFCPVMEEGVSMNAITEAAKVFVDYLKTPDSIKRFVGMELRETHKRDIPAIAFGHTHYSWQIAADLACEYVRLRNDKDVQQEQSMSNDEKQLAYFDRHWNMITNNNPCFSHCIGKKENTPVVEELRKRCHQRQNAA